MSSPAVSSDAGSPRRHRAALGYHGLKSNVDFEKKTFAEFAMVATSVPEPPVPTLVVVALAGLELAARRKREQRS